MKLLQMKLPEKKKLADFEVAGDLYKVKTWNEMTKLERNGTSCECWQDLEWH